MIIHKFAFFTALSVLPLAAHAQLSGSSSGSLYDQLFYSSWYIISQDSNGLHCQGVTQTSADPTKGDLWSAPISFIDHSRQQGLGGALWDVEGALEINMNDGGRIVRVSYGSDPNHDTQMQIFTTTQPDCQQIIENPSIYQQQASGQ